MDEDNPRDSAGTADPKDSREAESRERAEREQEDRPRPSGQPRPLAEDPEGPPRPRR